jgi:hypothetical protein
MKQCSFPEDDVQALKDFKKKKEIEEAEKRRKESEKHKR